MGSRIKRCLLWCKTLTAMHGLFFMGCLGTLLFLQCLEAQDKAVHPEVVWALLPLGCLES